MSHFKLLLLAFLLLASCKRKTAAIGVAVTDSIAKSIGTLSTDSSISIVSKFPDSVRYFLFRANRDLYECILVGYKEKGDSAVFSSENFVSFTLKQNYIVVGGWDILSPRFDPDTSKTNPILIAEKESLNMTERIEYSRVDKNNQFIISSQFRVTGKNYILKWRVFAPDKKTSYDVRKLKDNVYDMHYGTDYDVIKL